MVPRSSQQRARPLDVQVDAAFANGVRAVLTRLAYTRRPEHDDAWKDCEAMELNRRAEIHALSHSTVSPANRAPLDNKEKSQ